jgi:hypothetical protein
MVGHIPEIGLDDGRLADIAALIRTELAQEVDAGFPVLGRIPSTGTSNSSTALRPLHRPIGLCCWIPSRGSERCISFRRR